MRLPSHCSNHIKQVWSHLKYSLVYVIPLLDFPWLTYFAIPFLKKFCIKVQINFTCSRNSYKWNYTVYVFCVYFLLLSLVFIKFIHGFFYFGRSFLFITECYFIVWKCPSPFLSQLNIWLIFTYINMLWTFSFKSFCGHIVTFLLGKYLELELLDCMTNICLTSQKTAHLFSTEFVQFYTLLTTEAT